MGLPMYVSPPLAKRQLSLKQPQTPTDQPSDVSSDASQNSRTSAFGNRFFLDRNLSSSPISFSQNSEMNAFLPSLDNNLTDQQPILEIPEWLPVRNDQQRHEERRRRRSLPYNLVHNIQRLHQLHHLHRTREQMVSTSSLAARRGLQAAHLMNLQAEQSSQVRSNPLPPLRSPVRIRPTDDHHRSHHRNHRSQYDRNHPQSHRTHDDIISSTPSQTNNSTSSTQPSSTALDEVIRRVNLLRQMAQQQERLLRPRYRPSNGSSRSSSSTISPSIASSAGTIRESLLENTRLPPMSVDNPTLVPTQNLARLLPLPASQSNNYRYHRHYALALEPTINNGSFEGDPSVPFIFLSDDSGSNQQTPAVSVNSIDLEGEERDGYEVDGNRVVQLLEGVASGQVFKKFHFLLIRVQLFRLYFQLQQIHIRLRIRFFSCEEIKLSSGSSMSKHYEYFESEINGRAIYLNSTTNLKKPLASLLVLLFFSTLWTAYHISSNTLRTVQVPSGISFEAFREGLEKCAAFKRRPTDFTNRTRVNNPRRDTNSETIIFKNGNILDGLGNKIGKDVAIKDGLILSIGENLEVEGAKVIDLKKKYMSPGLVDMHSHLGVNSWPELFGTDDTNESTDPITPYVRAIDGLNPSDPALRIIASGGITTSLVLPGSANLMGGEGYVIKLRPVDTLSVEDMDINAHISFTEQKPWKWMKMACGENPKGVYGRRLKKMPKTRLGEAWLFRKRFAEAQVLKQKQDDWCDSAEKLGNNEQLNTRFPEDLSNELLVALLRGDVKLNVHCYETHDIEAFIRHSIEFKFNIAAIHHALDAYRIPSIIKRTSNEITVAIFSDLWGYKKEAFQASTKAPLILSEANIPVALKSDHPVTNAQNLVYEAAKAHHYGLSEGLALAAVTSIPAKALGLEYRIGRIAEGYDADLVIWNSHPLSLGATPLEVYIDGIPQFRASMSVLAQAPKKPISLNNSMSPDRKSGDQRKMRISSSVLITNVGKIFVNENSIMNALSRPENERMKILVQGGIVKCLGYSCDKIESIVADHVVDLEGGYVLPGIVAVGTDLGLSEIEQEPRTRDGIVASLSSPNDTHHIIHALDGLKLGGKHLDVAYKAGILTAVTAPLSRFGVVIGVSTAFKTGGITIIDDENDEIVKEAVALHFHIGTSFLDEKTPTVSSQINFLRQALIQNIEPSFTNVYGRAARGEIPVAVYTHSKDEIASLIRLKKQVNLKNGKLRLGVYGRRLKKMPKTRLGEAWLFRKRFAEAQVLKQKQDDWCDSAEKLGNNEQLNTRFPEDLSNELLVALLRGDVKLNVHCYETHDIEAFIRHSIEFKFNIAAIHHALDAYRIPSIIKRTSNEITVAIFSDLWGYKKEAFQASTKAPLILSEANIPVALKSDHPVTNAQNLVYEAAKAHHYGLSEGLALAAVTSIPAKALGLEYRIGRIAEGYDADLVIWNSHPLSLGATPLEVYIDGIPQFRASMSVLAQAPKKPISLNNSMSPDRKSGDQRKMRISSSVLITNVGKIFVNENSIMNALSRPENERMKILVQGGIVKCLGYSCDKIESIVADHVVDLEGGYVLPGIVAVGTDLGLSEIEQEPRTRDGIVASLSSPNDTHHIIHALDGLKLGGKHLDVAYKAGILTAVTAPLSRFGVVIGVSTAFKTGGITIIDDENDEIVKEAVALHFHIGTSFLDEKTPTVSSQINFLRQALIQNIEPSFTNVYGRAARGEIPVAVYTHSKDEIASLIRLKKQVNLKNGKLRLVIIGGAEAHFLAEKLAKHKIAVVLVPSRPTPTLWTAQNVLTGPPLTNNTGIDILNAHKVLLGIGIEDSGLARNLVWDAGWVFQNSGGEISEKEAVGFITWNLEKIFGLKQKSEEIKGLKEGSIADFVAYDGNPFDLKTNVRIVAGGGRKNVLINPEQD
ncbi:hypothetical protein G9A89_022852 [Geosiphon pyriformis]|nr:hypothetical protein G9A89_022852 [Geosiphon pyriformis]